MKNELLSCKYCGGKLSHDKGHVWVCDYCGRSAVISNENESYKGKLRIEHEKEIYSLNLGNTCTIVANYKKRATLADEFPMIVQITSGDESLIIEHVKNIGKGTITLSYDVTRIKLTIVGKIKVNIEGQSDTSKYLDTGSSIILDTIKLTLTDENDNVGPQV